MLPEVLSARQSSRPGNGLAYKTVISWRELGGCPLTADMRYSSEAAIGKIYWLHRFCLWYRIYRQNKVIRRRKLSMDASRVSDSELSHPTNWVKLGKKRCWPACVD